MTSLSKFHSVLCAGCGEVRWDCACPRPECHVKGDTWFLRAMSECPDCWRITDAEARKQQKLRDRIYAKFGAPMIYKPKICPACGYEGEGNLCRCD